MRLCGVDSSFSATNKGSTAQVILGGMKAFAQCHEEISRLCASHRVKRLYAFGSVLTGRFNEASDVDFIVAFREMDLEGYADNYYSLKHSLETLFNKPVDLLEEQAIRNPYFREAVNSQRKLVYGK